MNFSEASQKKILFPEQIEKKTALLKATNKKIATLNGSFDLLHAGHLYILYEAAKQADILIVALNSDHSIQGYKSKDRPIVPLKMRLEMMAAIECVHYVTWFDELDPREILKKIKPDVHVNGAEYGENCIEAKIVKENGGRLHLVSLVAGFSTTDIVNKIKALASDNSCRITSLLSFHNFKVRFL